jgi:hypothetical protein
MGQQGTQFLRRCVVVIGQSRQLRQLPAQHRQLGALCRQRALLRRLACAAALPKTTDRLGHIWVVSIQGIAGHAGLAAQTGNSRTVWRWRGRANHCGQRLVRRSLIYREGACEDAALLADGAGTPDLLER